MKIYRVHYYTQRDGSDGYEYFTSKAAADKAANKFRKEHKPYEGSEPHVQETTCGGSLRNIVDYLNRFASHANNG